MEAMIKVSEGVYAVNYFDNYYTSQKPLNSVRRTTLVAYRLRSFRLTNLCWLVSLRHSTVLDGV